MTIVWRLDTVMCPVPVSMFGNTFSCHPDNIYVANSRDRCCMFERPKTVRQAVLWDIFVELSTARLHKEKRRIFFFLAYSDTHFRLTCMLWFGNGFRFGLNTSSAAQLFATTEIGTNVTHTFTVTTAQHRK